jgi:hypothetical protein
MAVEGMNDSRGAGWETAQEMDEQLRGSRAGAGAQVSVSFSASLLGDVTTGSPKDNGVGFGL